MARLVSYLMESGPCKGAERPAIVVSENRDGEDREDVTVEGGEVRVKPDAEAEADTPRDADGGRRVRGTVNLVVFCDRDKDNLLDFVVYRPNVGKGKEPGDYK